MDPDLSKITKPQIIKVDDKTAIKYAVVKENIDLDGLRMEKQNLEMQLDMAEPTKDQLVELGTMYHPYYLTDKIYIQNRIKEIDEILEK